MLTARTYLALQDWPAAERTFLLDPRFAVIGGSGDGQTALSETAALSPELLIVDSVLSGMDGQTLLRHLQQRIQPPRTVYLMRFFREKAPLADEALPWPGTAEALLTAARQAVSHPLPCLAAAHESLRLTLAEALLDALAMPRTLKGFSATALAAETPSGTADAAMAAAGVKDGQTVTQKELYAADPEGTVSFANLETRVRENNLTVRMLEESIASIDVVDYEKMYDDLKDALNSIAKTQRAMLQLGQLDSAMGNTSLSGSFSSEYIFSSLDASYDSLRDTFDDLKDGKIQDDYAAAKRQLENAENQVVMGAETLYMAILEMQNTRSSLQRQLDALDRTVEEMELRYKLGQISALTLQQVKDGRTQMSSGISTLDMNIRNYTRQLEVMLGLEQAGSLTLTEPPQVSDKLVAEMDYDTALAAAKEKSYDLFAAQRTLDDAQETYKDSIKGYGQNNYHYKSAVHTYEAAKYTYQSTVQSFEMNFRAMYDAVADYQQVLKASQSALDYQKNAYAASQLKYQQGSISKNALLEAQDSLASAEADVSTAKHNLFSAYHTYLWAVEYGILN